MRLRSPIPLGAEVAFLSLPASYPEPTSQVETVETHLSWVFLTDRHARKLKKPVHSQDVDFTTVAARRANCGAELQPNRRLSDDTYLDIVPLLLDASGRLRLTGEGRAIDWLLKMRRLPAARMLDRLILSGAATSEDVQRVVTRLARFYRNSAPVEMSGAAYREAFAKGIAENLRELRTPAYGLPGELIAGIGLQQRNLLEHRPELFDARAEAGRIIEAHGDLRPEHICLEAEPQIIDCLEFSRALRILDPADELAFLALECERLGAPAFATTISRPTQGSRRTRQRRSCSPSIEAIVPASEQDSRSGTSTMQRRATRPNGRRTRKFTSGWPANTANASHDPSGAAEGFRRRRAPQPGRRYAACGSPPRPTPRR